MNRMDNRILDPELGGLLVPTKFLPPRIGAKMVPRREIIAALSMDRQVVSVNVV